MPGHIYKTIDLVGSSPDGVTQAIESAVNRAGQTLKGLDWFEVGQIRGEIVGGRIAFYQVGVKIGFRVMSDEELKAEP